MADMVMPKMGESITEGTILKWLKKEGDEVEQDEVILEISTDKVDTEIPAPASGVLSKILAAEGDVVEVGAKIAEISDAGEKSAWAAKSDKEDGKAAAAEEKEKAKRAEEAEAKKKAEAEEEKKAADGKQDEDKEKEKPAAKDDEKKDAAEEKTNGERRFYSPLVRSIAEKEGVSKEELAQIEGSGHGGRVNKDDILSYIEARKEESPKQREPEREERMPKAPVSEAPKITGDVEIVEMDNMRKSIAEHMVRSVQTSPHVYSITESDVSHLVRYREAVKDEFQRKEGFKLTYTAFFAYAVAKALREFPYVNSSVDGTKIILKKEINIGIAVALENGLIVPVVKNADTLNLIGLARTINDLANRARNKRLMPNEVQGGTFSITNVGSFGNLYGTPIISQPQVAILGLGAIKKRVVAVDNAIAIRDMVYLSLGYDHRIIDGAMGGRFLQRVVQNLHEMQPEQI